MEEDDTADVAADDKLNVVAAKNNLSPNSRLIECPKTECSKKYRDLDALKYHLSFSHNDLQKPNKAVKTEEVNGSGHKQPSSKTSNGQIKKEAKTEVKEEPTAAVVAAPPVVATVSGPAEQKPGVDLSVKQEESKPKPLSSDITNGRDRQPVKASNSVGHGVLQMLASKPSQPSHHQPLGLALNGSGPGAGAAPSAGAYSNHLNPASRFSAQPQQAQLRTVSPAYSDISDEEPETTAPVGLISKGVVPKPSLLNARRDTKQPDSRAPLDLTQPNFDAFRAPQFQHQQQLQQQQQQLQQQQQQQQLQLPPHMGPSAGLRFPSPQGLPTSTPSLNMLHSIMASAKLQELQQAMAATSGPGAIRPPPSQPLSIPNISASPYSKSPSSLPPGMRPELSHSHLLMPGFGPGASPASKMAAMASADAAKRALTPVTSGSMSLPLHLSPFAPGKHLQGVLYCPQ